jgi:hypothetical protein
MSGFGPGSGIPHVPSAAVEQLKLTEELRRLAKQQLAQSEAATKLYEQVLLESQETTRLTKRTITATKWLVGLTVAVVVMTAAVVALTAVVAFKHSGTTAPVTTTQPLIPAEPHPEKHGSTSTPRTHPLNTGTR